jgi:hypothetical protein
VEGGRFQRWLTMHRALFIPRTEERAPILRARGCFITRGAKKLARAVFSCVCWSKFFDAGTLNWRYLPRGRLLVRLLEML